MKNDSLMNLLNRADQSGSQPILAPDLSNRVRAKARRRGRNRFRAGAFATAAACAILSVVLLRPHSIPHPPTPGDNRGEIAQLRRELAALETQAMLHQQTADALQQTQELAHARRDQADFEAQPDALYRVNEARDRAAMLLLREAERAALNNNNEPAARESYQRAARLFPETPAGRIAAARIGPLGILM
jgi:hypothetical protein